MQALRPIALVLAGVIALWRPVIGQVSTNVPEVLPGARQVTVERIKIYGKALEGNLEGNPVDREATVVLPPGYRRDVVSYIDEHYRTIPDRNNRGLVGHSMGGYGASRIGMKYPDVFGSLYIMSPCCMSPLDAGPSNPASEEALAAVKTPGDSAKLPFGLRTQLAVAAAWSPNPNNPPLYFDVPIGPNQQAVLAKWAANAPLAFIDQYIENLVDTGPLQLMSATKTT